jgi:hypothetical protein
MDDRHARQLAWVCEQGDRLRRLARGRGEEPELDRLLTALRQDGTADVPVLLAEVEELLRRCGVPGALRGGPPALVGTDHGGHPVEEFYLCPRERDVRCIRLVHAFDVTMAAGGDPVCHVTGRPLRLRRL